jgi:hypothetical protein
MVSRCTKRMATEHVFIWLVTKHRTPTVDVYSVLVVNLQVSPGRDEAAYCALLYRNNPANHMTGSDVESRVPGVGQGTERYSVCLGQ